MLHLIQSTTAMAILLTLAIVLPPTVIPTSTLPTQMPYTESTLTGTNQTAGNAPPYSVTSANTNVKVYAPQSPAVAANVATTINYLATSGGVVSFQNQTPW
jgi:hypothetical protein